MPSEDARAGVDDALVGAVGVWYFDPDGVIVACGEAAAATLGWTPSELIGRPAHATVHHSTAAGVPTLASSCPVLLVAWTGEPVHVPQDVFWRRDGSAVPVWWTSWPLAGAGEARAGGVVVFGLRRPDGTGAVSGPMVARAPQTPDERMLALGQLSEVLTVLDVDEGLHRVASLAASSLTDWCVVDTLDDGRVTRVALADRVRDRPTLAATLGPLPEVRPTGTHSLARVLRGDDTVAVELGAAGLASLLDAPVHDAGGETRPVDALDRAQAELFRDLGAAHAFVVPLRARGEVLGAMTWVRTDPANPFTDSDILLATVFGMRVGLWLDNVRLYDQNKRVAETLQRSLLTALPQPDHLELVARYAPAVTGTEVGGDWYDGWITADGRTMLVVGDVSGHDIDAAARMAQLRNMLRVVGLEHADDPSRAVTRVDRAMAQFGIPGQASLVAVTIDQTPAEAQESRRSLVWTNAGHLPPLLLEPGKAPRLLETSPDLLLGVRANAPRHDWSADVAPGATLVLYTDGLVEQVDHSLDDGLDRLLAAATEFGSLPLPALCDALLARLAAADERRDDVAVVAVRFHDEAGPRPAGAGPNFLPAEHDDAEAAAPDGAHGVRRP